MAGIMVKLIIFFFGTCIGSFLNVVVYRLNHNLSPFRGRSFCPQCKKKIPWQDNIPLLSFVLLRGKCRFCHSPISWQYPLVELGTGILTWVVYSLSYSMAGNCLTTGYHLLITYAFIAIFVSDLRYQTIPDEIVYLMIIISLPYALRVSYAFQAALGAAIFFGLLVLVTRGRGMGVGDVKLAGLMGLALGFPGIVVALMFAFLTGALAGVILVLTRKKRFGEHIPFGPFLTSATWISLFWGQKIWQFYAEKALV
jgi:prepilin signal peptidase PulO-like enzyme (type II secretory pathway)